MRVLVNALSVNNLSGRHVLQGHLLQLSQHGGDHLEFTLLHHAANRDIAKNLGELFDAVEAPPYTGSWQGRAYYEFSQLGKLVNRTGANVVFSPSGTWTPGLSCRQVSLAQNPWALVDALKRSSTEAMKAAIQRKNYQQAQRNAHLMVFNSHFMGTAYAENAGQDAKRSIVAYQALDDEVHDLAESLADKQERNEHQILCVSAMASHKGVETLVAALERVRNLYGVPANLVLAGSWPDRKYKNRIVSLIQQLSLTSCVEMKGYVERDELNDLYARSRLFCLMSHCESFGIPAVEAQLFGTPVVSSNTCAIPEICGDGGLFPAAGDVDGTAAALAQLLMDSEKWQSYSERARANAARYRWEACSQPLVNEFLEMAQS
jgi:glycosyltransferase involved in cell wall biosynthesis